jgi:glucans biosynthesis protein C
MVTDMISLAKIDRDISLDRLRLLLIVFVVFLHAAQPYCSFAVYDPNDYAHSPTPLVDLTRWPALDLPSALVYTFVMPLMFLISGLFVRTGLERHGSWGFFRNRLKRLGIPFLIIAFLLAPLAIWPCYLLSTPDSPTPYWLRFFTTDEWRVGTGWFLWVLLAFDGVVALAYRFAPFALRLLRCEPSGFVILLVSLVTFVPLCPIIDTETWVMAFGPFDVQPAKLLLYFAYFLLGVSIGGSDFWRTSGGPRGWGWWFGFGILAFVGEIACFVVWRGGFTGPARILSGAAFMAACAGFSIGLLGLFRRYAGRHRRILDRLADNSYGIYVLHYAIVLWTQYLMMPAVWTGSLKFAVAMVVGGAGSWVLSAAIRQMPPVRRLL